MKKLCFAIVIAAGFTAFAADQTITGVISDSMCATNHGKMQKGDHKLNDQDCTVACVKMMGQKYVLAADDKVYQIANQDFAGLEKSAGSTVQATGQVSADGKLISLANLTASAKK
jgi:hypothetical protein